MRLKKTWTAVDKLSIIWKSDLTDKMKRSFFQAAVVSILLYGCTTWTLTKRLEKKLDGNYTRMLRAVLNKSGRQHPTKHQLYDHLSPITKTIQVRRARHTGHCWRSRDELISDVLLWTLTYGRAKAGRPAGTYIQQLCEDTGCSLEDLPEVMNDREKWRERVKDFLCWRHDMMMMMTLLIVKNAVCPVLFTYCWWMRRIIVFVAFPGFIINTFFPKLQLALPCHFLRTITIALRVPPPSFLQVPIKFWTENEYNFSLKCWTFSHRIFCWLNNFKILHKFSVTD